MSFWNLLPFIGTDVITVNINIWTGKYFLPLLSGLFQIFDIFVCWKPGSLEAIWRRQKQKSPTPLSLYQVLAFNDCDATQSEQSGATLDSSALTWWWLVRSWLDILPHFRMKMGIFHSFTERIFRPFFSGKLAWFCLKN